MFNFTISLQLCGILPRRLILKYHKNTPGEYWLEKIISFFKTGKAAG